MSSIKNKLYNYEQAPPARAWDRIAAALDESHLSDEFPAVLYHAEVSPPSSSWNKIAAALEPEAAVVQMPAKRSSSFLRYAIAACVISIVALGIMTLTGNLGTKTNPPNDEIVTTTGTDNNPVTEPRQVPNQNNLPAREIGAIEKEQEAPVIAQVDDQPKNITSKKNRNTYSNKGTTSSMEPVYAYNEHIPADNYVMLMTPNGIVRMSKKLGDIVCCVAGEVEDEDCKDQLKKWQQKMATSSAAPGNFMDILSLVSSLNDNDL
jgi:hypothetical protein